MELGKGWRSCRGSTPVTQVKESSSLASVSPPPHNRTARKIQQNKEVAHRLPY